MSSITNMDINHTIHDLINNTTQGMGIKRTDIIIWIKSYITSNNLATRIIDQAISDVTDDEINMVIDSGLENGELIRPLGPNGPITLKHNVYPILTVASSEFTPVDKLIKDIIIRNNSFYYDTDAELKQMKKIYLMIKAGYLEANNQLEVRVSPNVVCVR
jgi:hypothetical protein